MKKSSGLFWGVLILLVGMLLLLRNLGYITIDIWGAIWPLMLILAGVWVLLGMRGLWSGEHGGMQLVSVPLEGSEQAYVRIEHGIGMATLSGAVEGGELMSGSFGGGLNYSTRVRDGVRQLRMKMADPGFPWWQQNYSWDFRLNGTIPLTIRLKGGAGILNFDLHDLRVRELDYDAGVGTASITMPAHAGLTTATVKAWDRSTSRVSVSARKAIPTARRITIPPRISSTCGSRVESGRLAFAELTARSLSGNDAII
jgi:hypothetical protein